MRKTGRVSRASKESHPGQQRASERKKRNKLIRKREHEAEAMRLGKTPEELKHERFLETLDSGERAALDSGMLLSDYHELVSRRRYVQQQEAQMWRREPRYNW